MSFDLSAIQKATLIALADACNYSEHAHPPEEAILRRFRSDMKGDAKKALKELHRMGLATRHPTGGSTTYYITRLGLKEAQS